MTSVFADNKPDARQGDTEKLAPEHSLFRKRYRQLSAEELALHDKIKDKADELAGLFADILRMKSYAMDEHIVLQNGGTLTIRFGQNIEYAIRHLEDSVYRAVKELTS